MNRTTASKGTIVLIHGLWLTPKSWAPWKARYERAGYTVVVPAFPGISDDGFEELCHLVTAEDPDTALCGRDVSGYPWNPPWPRCEACLAVARGQLN